ncbi:MAG: modulator protein [Methylotenera sp.]|nr:modulator protein [Oligoflexia bacterium]
MKEQNSNDYKPVSCDLMDQLEALSSHQTPVRLKVSQKDGSVAWLNGTITDIYARDHADYLKLDSGQEIRLDAVITHRSTDQVA